MLQLMPADIVVVRSPGIAAWLIRLGELFQGKPDLRNHVAMLHHSADGVNWYLEGRPSGLGWRAFRQDADPYASSYWSISNAAQPKSTAERKAACAAMLSLLRAPYDWDAIEADAAEALHLPGAWAGWGSGTLMPGHVVCSSSTAWSYRKAGLAAPEAGGGRFTEPADWDDFITRRAWTPGGAPPPRP